MTGDNKERLSFVVLLMRHRGASKNSKHAPKDLKPLCLTVIFVFVIRVKFVAQLCYLHTCVFCAVRV
jgi:hypothetical protein